MYKKAIEKYGLLWFPEGIDQENKSITFDGKIIVKGDIENKCVITASGDIHINGNVTDSFITSTEGSVFIYKNCFDSEIESYISVECGTAVEFYNEEYSVSNSRITTNYKIWTNSVLTNQQGKNSVLTIKNSDKIKIPRKLIGLNNKINEKLIDLKKYKRITEVLKVLGNKINNLPQDKRDKILEGVAGFKKIQFKIRKMLETLDILKKLYNNQSDEKIFQIFIKNNLEPGTLLKIETREKKTIKKWTNIKAFLSLNVITIVKND